MSTRPSDEWMEPGAHEVVRGVYRIPLPLPNDGLRAVNVYLVVGSDGIVCIDSGWALPESRQMFETSLASLEFGPLPRHPRPSRSLHAGARLEKGVSDSS